MLQLISDDIVITIRLQTKKWNFFFEKSITLEINCRIYLLGISIGLLFYSTCAVWIFKLDGLLEFLRIVNVDFLLINVESIEAV